MSSQALTRRLLQRLQRRRPGYLEQVVVVPSRFDLLVGAGELLQRPRWRREELEFVLGFSFGDAVGSNQRRSRRT